MIPTDEISGAPTVDDDLRREGCPFDTDGDGNCGQRNCPFCGEFCRPATSGSQDVRLREDDEALMHEIQKWLEGPALPAARALMVFPTRRHAEVVTNELMRRIDATQHRRGGQIRLLAPGGTEIHVLTEDAVRRGVCGMAVNRVFVHDHVGFEAYAAVKPCEKGDEYVIRDGMIRRA